MSLLIVCVCVAVCVCAGVCVCVRACVCMCWRDLEDEDESELPVAHAQHAQHAVLVPTRVCPPLSANGHARTACRTVPVCTGVREQMPPPLRVRCMHRPRNIRAISVSRID